MARTVVAVVDDIFFGSRIKEAAVGSGADLVFTARKDETIEHVAASRAKLVLVDLHGGGFSPPDLIRALKADPRTKGARVVGYFQHEDTAVKKRAEGAGCDLVVPRSAFVKLLPKLFSEVA